MDNFQNVITGVVHSIIQKKGPSMPKEKIRKERATTKRVLSSSCSLCFYWSVQHANIYSVCTLSLSFCESNGQSKGYLWPLGCLCVYFVIYDLLPFHNTHAGNTNKLSRANCKWPRWLLHSKRVHILCVKAKTVTVCRVKIAATKVLDAVWKADRR